ncbi:hypothetical protein VK792_11120 [Mesobacterium sp. TK19101]|uniref:Lipoprotein n=1 Tax=Mesobacterium hydrothermale TaxID=3111907 RepID=A0ABU6HIA4_9RHOB|nr:hypothetical protein [Mesobacterium sp. TK19101]MEC3861837.1 hypothetical protein [Mesobacterium sp. TK19101]
MRRLIPWLAVWVCWALSATAATIPVRSGEHDDFTRLVLELPVAMGWALDGSGEALTLRLDQPGHGFDLSTVFDRIPRDRLTGVEQTAPSQLSLTLACPCTAEPFLFRDRFLVIDLKDAVAPEAAPPRPEPRASPTQPITLPVHLGTESSRLMQASLEAAMQDGPRGQLLDLAAHMAVSSAFDPPRPDPDQTARISVQGRPPAPPGYCPAGALTLTQDWAGEGDYARELAARRQATYDLAGHPVPSARLALAQFYVSQAQGTEAYALLQDDSSKEAALVRAMAATLDRPERLPASVFRTCPGLVLWDVMRLQKAGERPEEGWDADDLFRAYTALSPTLRRYWAVPLVDYLRDTGHGDAANRIEAYLIRTDDGPTHLTPEEENHHPSHETSPAEELLDRMTSLEAIRAATESDRRLIESFRTEYRGSRLEPAFWQAEVRVHLVEQDYARALDQVLQGRQSYDDRFDALYGEVLSELAATAPDIQFLKTALALGQIDGGLPPPPEDARRRVEERLALLGF